MLAWSDFVHDHLGEHVADHRRCNAGDGHNHRCDHRSSAGENILGIDFRVATGQLYALGSASRLYTINLLTGAATQVGSAGAFSLSGSSFGFDFNPTVDRIRVVSDAGQNLRLNPNDGTLTATDVALNPGTPNVIGSGYTNTDLDPGTGTALYAIDSIADALYQQNPPNDGALVLVGSLGLDIGGAGAFDIAFPGNIGYAALLVGGVTSLYQINLGTGAATLVGAIGNGATGISGLSAVPAAVPEPATLFSGVAVIGLMLLMRRWIRPSGVSRS